MAERYSGHAREEKKWDIQRIRETARVFGWGVATAMIVGGVVLSSQALVQAGVVTALMDATADVSLSILGGVGKDLKRDMFGSSRAD